MKLNHAQPETVNRDSGTATSNGRRFRRIVRRWTRAFKARFMPLKFAQWVNMERCSIEIQNSAGGTWEVRIGCKCKPCESRNLGEAMLDAFWQRELDPEWQWQADKIRALIPNPFEIGN